MIGTPVFAKGVHWKVVLNAFCEKALSIHGINEFRRTVKSENLIVALDLKIPQRLLYTY